MFAFARVMNVYAQIIQGRPPDVEALDRVFLTIKGTCDYAMVVATASDRQRIAQQSRWQRENGMRRVIEEKKPKRSTITERFANS